jgi:hypothetical protein
MARSRNIKPGFFTNDVLAELPPLARLLFAGLWTICDREGRTEDRPNRIKVQLLAYDECDCNSLLQALHDKGFIRRYEVAGARLIQVVTWGKHQNPHVKEAPSAYPAPDEHQTSTVQEQDKELPLPERAGLIPDSLLLIPDSLKEISNLTVASTLPAEEVPTLALVPSKAAKPKPPDCPHLEVLALWGEVLPALPQHLPSRWTGTRANHLRARWRETAVEKGWVRQEEGIEYLRNLFAYVGRSPFLTGRVRPKADGRPFVIELEWLVNPNNWAKVLEGKYHQEAA